MLQCTKSVTTVGRHYASNVYCLIWPEELSNNAERDLLALAKYLVT